MIDHHHGGLGLGLRRRRAPDRFDSGDRIGEIETLAGLEPAGIEILAHGANHGIGVLGGDADILQHARERIARIQGHRALLDPGIGIGIVGLSFCAGPCGSLARISFMNSA